MEKYNSRIKKVQVCNPERNAIIGELSSNRVLGAVGVLDGAPDPSDEKTWDWSAVYFISLWMLAHDPRFADNDYMDNWDNAKKAYVGFLTEYTPAEYFDGGLPEKLTDYLNKTK